MHEVFAEQLRWWLVSVMTLILGIVSASIAALLSQSCTTSSVSTCIGMLGEAVALFPMLFLVVAAWHASDLMQNRKPRWWLGSLLTGYPMLLGALSLLLLLHTSSATGRFTVPAHVLVETDPRLRLPIVGLLLLLPLLTLAKGVLVAHSRLLKRS